MAAFRRSTVITPRDAGGGWGTFQTISPMADKYKEWLSDKGLMKMRNLDGRSAVQAFDLLILSEAFYVEQGLRVVSELYEQHLLRTCESKSKKLNVTGLTTSTVIELFHNISAIYSFHRDFYDKLLTCRLQGSNSGLDDLGRILHEFVPFFKLYNSYVKHIKKSQQLLRELKQANSTFNDFCTLNEGISGARLDHLLRLPIARLPQYMMFFSHIYLTLPEQDSLAAVTLGQAVVAVQEVADVIAKAQRDAVARAQVVHLQEEVFKNAVLVTPSRYVLNKGALKRIFNPNIPNLHLNVSKKYKGKEDKVYLFVLFNDMLLYGSTRKSKLVKHAMRLEGMKVTSLKDGAQFQHAFAIKSELEGNHHGVWVLCAARAQAKERWMSQLSEAIRKCHKKRQSGEDVDALNEMMVSCEDYENMILRKKVRKARMIKRPALPKEIQSSPSPTKPQAGVLAQLIYDNPHPTIDQVTSRRLSLPAPTGSSRNKENLPNDLFRTHSDRNLITPVASRTSPPRQISRVQSESQVLHHHHSHRQDASLDARRSISDTPSTLSDLLHSTVSSSSSSQAFPIPPPVDTDADKPIHREAAFPYRAHFPEGLSMAVGDVLIILQQNSSGWWRARSLRSGKEGHVPSNYLRQLRNPGKLANHSATNPAGYATEGPGATSSLDMTLDLADTTDPSTPRVGQVEGLATPESREGEVDKCDQCEENVQEWKCHECGQVFCSRCDERIHRGGARKSHQRQRVSTKPEITRFISTSRASEPAALCQSCFLHPQTVRCEACNGHLMCIYCDTKIHSGDGERSDHLRLTIRPTAPPHPKNQARGAGGDSGGKILPPQAANIAGPAPPPGTPPPHAFIAPLFIPKSASASTIKTNAVGSAGFNVAVPGPPPGSPPSSSTASAREESFPSSHPPPPRVAHLSDQPQPQLTSTSAAPPPPSRQQAKDSSAADLRRDANDQRFFLPPPPNRKQSSLGQSNLSVSNEDEVLFRYPAPELCTLLSSARADWLKLQFIFYSHKVSGQNSVQRPNNYLTPPPTPPKNQLVVIHSNNYSPPRSKHTSPTSSSYSLPSSKHTSPTAKLSRSPPPRSRNGSPAHSTTVSPIGRRRTRSSSSSLVGKTSPISPIRCTAPAFVPPPAPPLPDLPVAPPLQEIPTEKSKIVSRRASAPTISTTPAKQELGGGDDLLAQLQAKSKQLKRADSSKSNAPDAEPPASTATGLLAATLQNSLNAYRKFVEGDESASQDEGLDDSGFADEDWE